MRDRAILPGFTEGGEATRPCGAYNASRVHGASLLIWRATRVFERMIRMEERIINLETKFALMEDQLDALNRTVFRQQQQMELLQDQLRLLYSQMQSQGGSGAERRDLRDEIPPHY